MSHNVPDFQPKKRLEAAQLNQLVALANKLKLVGGDNVDAASIAGAGTSISVEGQNHRYYTPLICKVTTTGPNGDEDDYTDYRYWLRVQKNVTTAANAEITGTLDIEDDDETDTEDEDKHDERHIITGFNLNEFVEGTHSLTEDSLVIVLPVKFDDGEEADTVRYVIVMGGASLPTGQYQHMIFQMVSQNQNGWEFAQAHALL